MIKKNKNYKSKQIENELAGISICKISSYYTQEMSYCSSRLQQAYR
jgi:hypothetical protein